MDEYIEIKNKLKDNSIAAVLESGKLFASKEIILKIIIEKLKEDEDVFTDSIVAADIVDRATAMVLVYSNIAYAYAKNISVSALEVFDDFGIECEYNNEFIEDENNSKYYYEIEKIFDPKEMYNFLSKKSIDKLGSSL